MMPSEFAPTANLTDPACRFCGTPLEVSWRRVRLWDGKLYCEECVEKHYPGLSDYAREHEVLDDEIPYDRSFLLREQRKVMAFLTVAIVSTMAFLIYAAGPEFRVAAALYLGGFGMLILAATYLGGRLTLYWTRNVHYMRVRVRDGSVTITDPENAYSRPRVFALEDLRWYLGSIRDEGFTLPRSQAYRRHRSVYESQPNRETVLLVAPANLVNIAWKNRRVAVGSTDAMRRIWVAFLRLAGVPEDEP